MHSVFVCGRRRRILCSYSFECIENLMKTRCWFGITVKQILCNIVPKMHTILILHRIEKDNGWPFLARYNDCRTVQHNMYNWAWAAHINYKCSYTMQKYCWAYARFFSLFFFILLYEFNWARANLHNAICLLSVCVCGACLFDELN